MCDVSIQKINNHTYCYYHRLAFGNPDILAKEEDCLQIGRTDWSASVCCNRYFLFRGLQSQSKCIIKRYSHLY